MMRAAGPEVGAAATAGAAEEALEAADCPAPQTRASTLRATSSCSVPFGQATTSCWRTSRSSAAATSHWRTAAACVCYAPRRPRTTEAAVAAGCPMRKLQSSGAASAARASTAGLIATLGLGAACSARSTCAATASTRSGRACMNSRGCRRVAWARRCPRHPGGRAIGRGDDDIVHRESFRPLPRLNPAAERGRC